MEQNQSFSQNIDTLFSNLEEFTKKEPVLGTPVTYGGKTLIPVVSVTFGYGSGAMPTPTGQQGGTGTANTGTGTGLGARINTDAVVVIDNENDNISMLSISGKSGLTQMMDKIPQALSNMRPNNQQQGQGQTQQQ